MKIAASSCLVGFNCTYKGSHNLVPVLQKMYEDGLVVCVCPEVLGGLSTPRDPAEIQRRNPLVIQTCNHKDVTNEYIQGSFKALQILKENNIDVVVLKFRSPSCGSDGVYDGSFSHKLIKGQGVFAALCEENNIKVFNEFQIGELLKYIGKEEYYGTYFKNPTSI